MFEQTMELPLIWDAIAVMWRQCIELPAIIFQCSDDKRPIFRP